MDNYKIKIIETRDDLKLSARLLMEAYNAPPWNDEWTMDTAYRKLECYFNSPKFYGIQVFDENNLVGSFVGNVEPYFLGDHFYLKDMFVSVKHHHKGIGRFMMSQLKSFIESNTIGMMTLFTSNESPAYTFYKKEGFEEMDGMRFMIYAKEE